MKREDDVAQDRPTVEELLEAVEEFLRDEAMPRLEGRASFHARVAANVVAIVRRELATGTELDGAERRGLLELLAGDENGSDSLGERSTKELARELCRRIRSGAMAPDEPRLREHLWETALGKLSIDNPRYRAYRRALGEQDPAD